MASLLTSCSKTLEALEVKQSEAKAEIPTDGVNGYVEIARKAA